MKTGKRNSNFGKVVLLGATIFTLGLMVACDSASDVDEDTTDNASDSTNTDVDVVVDDSVTFEVDTTAVNTDSVDTVVE